MICWELEEHLVNSEARSDWFVPYSADRLATKSVTGTRYGPRGRNYRFFVKTVSRSISVGRFVYFVSDMVSDVPVRVSFETM